MFCHWILRTVRRNDKIVILISHSPTRDTCAHHRKDQRYLRHSGRPSNRGTIASIAWRVCNRNSPIRYLNSASREQLQSPNWCEHIRRPDECKEIKRVWRPQVETLLDLRGQKSFINISVSINNWFNWRLENVTLYLKNLISYLLSWESWRRATFTFLVCKILLNDSNRFRPNFAWTLRSWSTRLLST